jgi:hypothetical protein
MIGRKRRIAKCGESAEFFSGMGLIHDVDVAKRERGEQGGGKNS